MPRMTDAIILCGGAGSRLKQVTGAAPKSMALIAHRPFLELLLKQLRRHGFRRVILAVGYQKEVIRNYFGDRFGDISLVYSEEEVPLGTGGALSNASSALETHDTLIMNGDSYTNADFRMFAAEHRNSKADVSMMVVPFDGRQDGGLVSVDAKGNVAQFTEKGTAPGAGYINAGVYVVKGELLKAIPGAEAISLEKQLLPQWLSSGKAIRTFVFRGECMDIGTPERYAEAQRLLAEAEREGAVP